MRCLLAAAVMIASTASAADRLRVRLGPTEGLDAEGVGEAVFGEDGALWVGTGSGVRRYDGDRFEAPAMGVEPLDLFHVARRAAGGVYAIDQTGRLFEVTDGMRTEFKNLPEPGRVRDARSDPDDHLWVVMNYRPYRLEASGSWRQPLADVWLTDEKAVGLQPRDGTMTVMTTHGVLALGPDGPERWLLRRGPGPVIDAIREPDGRLLVLGLWGQLERWDAGQMTPLWSGQARGISLLKRRNSIWAAWDHQLGYVTQSDALHTWSVPFGGALVNAPDGAMIMSGSGGLYVYPSPETRVLFTDDGLPKGAVRYLQEHQGQVWISTWRGPAVWTEGTIAAPNGGPYIPSRVCPDGDGVGWSVTTTWEPDFAGIVRWVPGQQPRLVAAHEAHGGCTSAPDGSVWLNTAADLWHAKSGALVRAGSLPGAGELITLDRADDLWAAVGDNLCSAPRSRADEHASWKCHDLSAFVDADPRDVLRTRQGDILVATSNAGLLRLKNGKASRHPKSDSVLGTRSMSALSPSPRGGVWIAGKGVLARVDPVTLDVFERLGPWQGLSFSAGEDVLELADGSVWIASVGGAAVVPSEARDVPDEPPPVRLSEVVVDGERLALTDRVQMPPPPNRVQLGFTATVFRNPAGLNYRISVNDQSWRSLEGGRIQLVDLQPGRHRVAVQASLDGTSWSDSAVAIVSVRAPWWQSPWVSLLALVAAALALFAAYRTRVALLVARERERTRIAMDLHDELGSGLGSIGLLAGVLDRDDLPLDKRRDLAARIRGTAVELHGGVHELVGSLRPGGATVGSLLDRLGERARDVLPDPDMDVRVVDPSDAAQVVLALSVRRELERIGAEALHNAARHGHPTQLTVGIRRAGTRWVLWIRDNGSGFDLHGDANTGLGLHSMRARAERIGAALVIESLPGHGTTINVHFDPSPRGAR